MDIQEPEDFKNYEYKQEVTFSQIYPNSNINHSKPIRIISPQRNKLQLNFQSMRLSQNQLQEKRFQQALSSPNLMQIHLEENDNFQIIQLKKILETNQTLIKQIAHKPFNINISSMNLNELIEQIVLTEQQIKIKSFHFAEENCIQNVKLKKQNICLDQQYFPNPTLKTRPKLLLVEQDQSKIKQEYELLEWKFENGIREIGISQQENLEYLLMNKRIEIDLLQLNKVHTDKRRKLEEEQQMLRELIQLQEMIKNVKQEKCKIKQDKDFQSPPFNKNFKNDRSLLTTSQKQPIIFNQINQLPCSEFSKNQNLDKNQNDKKKPIRIKTRACTVNLPDGSKKALAYKLKQNCKHICDQLGISQPITLSINKQNKSYILDLQSSFSSIYQSYDNIEAKVVLMISIKGDHNIVQYFLPQTPLEQVRKRFRLKKGVNCAFFSQSSYTEINEGQEKILKQNLKLLQYDICHIKFQERMHRNKVVPLHQKVYQVVKYLKMQGPSTLFITKYKLQGIQYPMQNQVTLDQCSKGKKLDYLVLAYFIQINVEVFYQNQSREFEFSILSNQTNLQIKEKFESVCNIVAKFQRWIVNKKQMKDDDTFQSIGIVKPRCRASVFEVPNLEFYGFSEQNTIQASSLTEFYIENDEDFIKKISQISFPAKQDQSVFRVWCLGIIFAAIKKHCKISFALNSIRQLIAKAKNYSNLWKARSAKQINYFSQHYVLHNILHSGDDQLKIELMRLYKRHSPLPLYSFNSKGDFVSFLEHHYWICNKSFVITSLQVNEPVKGKTTLLNKMFNAEFEISLGRHPNCSKSVYIQYDMYNNEEMPIDLIDISTGSISQIQKIKLCQISNLLIVHTTQSKLNQTITWIKTNCQNKSVIIFQRDNNIMDNMDNLFKQLSENQERGSFKIYSVPEMNYQNYHHYERGFEVISNNLHSQIELLFQQCDQSEQTWRFTNFISQSKPELLDCTQKIKIIQKQFSQISNTEFLLRDQGERKCVVPIHQSIIGVLQIKDGYLQRFISKLKDFIRTTRAKRLKIFKVISELQALLQNSNQKALQQAFPQIKRCIKRLLQIPLNQTSPRFRSTVQLLNNMNPNQTNIKKYHQQMRSLVQIFAFQIKPRQFSIQNFWRVLSTLFFQPNTLKAQEIQIFSKAKDLFSKQFDSGRGFEIINGDTLDIPIELLKSNLPNYENDKIMVIGIFGPQSSGKSTLLNFLFGCDFLSSDGRCTNGVYGTYYKINNRNIPNCNGFLLLDTQGLFANYRRKNVKGENFDNKLVLFLIKVCDIIILNTRGDVDKNCENILDLAFDSQLMEHKSGMRYPNFFFVLNQNGGSMNEQQLREVREMRQIIVKMCPHMEGYISSNESNSIPIAFNTSSKQIFSPELKRLQRKKKIPTEQFYRQTKNLSLKLINILEKRGKNIEGRTFNQIYQQMEAIWISIIQFPILTRYATRQIKNFEEQIAKWRQLSTQNTEKLINQWRLQIPKNIVQFQKWEQLIKKSFDCYILKLIEQFKNKFPENSDTLRNSLINKAALGIEPTMYSCFQRLKMEIYTKKYLLEIHQSQNRGLNSIARLAREIRQKSYKANKSLTDIEKQKEFSNTWNSYLANMKERINQDATSEEIFKMLKQFYQRSLKCAQFHININQNKLITLQHSDSLSQFGSKLADKILQQCTINRSLQTLDINPIISTPNIGPTDLSFKYLDMRAFFEIIPNKKSLFFRIQNIFQCINIENLKNQIQTRLREQDLIKKLVKGLQEDLLKFDCKLYGQLTSSAIAEVVVNAYFEPEKLKNIQKILRKKMPKLMKKSENTPSKLSEILNLTGNLSYLNFKVLKNQIQFEFGRYQVIFPENKVLENAVNYLICCYIQDKLSSFNYSVKSITQNLCSQLIKSFKKIGIQLKYVHIAKNSYRSYDFLPSNPIHLKSRQELNNIIKQFSNILNRDDIQRNIIQDSASIQKPYQIAFLQVQQIRLKQDYASDKTLGLYKNKSYNDLIKGIRNDKFRKFISPHIHFKRIFTQMIEYTCKLQSQLSKQQCTMKIINKIKMQLAEFNKDLQQISYCLTFCFKTQVYEFCFYLLWKFTDQEQWKRREQILRQLQIQQKNQFEIFLKIIDNNPKHNNDANASIFTSKYISFLQKMIQAQRKQHLRIYKKTFLQNYTRKKVQNLIDADISGSKDYKKIFEYLINPAKSLKNYYNIFISEQNSKMIQTFKTSINSEFNEILYIVNKLKQKLEGKQANWYSDDIIQSNQSSIIVKNIFLKVISEGHPISSDLKNNPYKLKPGVTFEVIQSAQHNFNIHFLNSPLQFQINNFAMFIHYLSVHLEKNKKKIEQQLCMTQENMEQFAYGVQLQLCSFKCPCCGRLCDTDMRLDPHHTLHKCQSGHQMRAIQGIRIQKQQNGKTQQYASILRCQDIEPFSKFTFNGRNIRWADFCQQRKKQWTFKGTEVLKQQKLFQLMWEKVGKDICKYRQQLDGLQMIYTPYSEQSIYKTILSQKLEETHYIFVLDGSSSMRGQPWKDLLKEMKTIMQDLAKDSQNRVSIIVFGITFSIIYNNESAAAININTVQFPCQRGTYYSAAFEGAISVLKSKLKHNIRLILISDGQSIYPDKEVLKLKEIKTMVEAAKKTFKYVSIFVGGQQPQLMNKIIKQLGGENRWVHNEAQISTLFRQIFNTK